MARDRFDANSLVDLRACNHVGYEDEIHDEEPGQMAQAYLRSGNHFKAICRTWVAIAVELKVDFRSGACSVRMPPSKTVRDWPRSRCDFR
jgi:hypothetical protein